MSKFGQESLDSTNAERSPSHPEEILRHLGLEYARLLGLTADNQAILNKLILKTFTDEVAGQRIFKPNSLSFALRSLQLAGAIPSEPNELKTYLENSLIGLFDIIGLKKINEQSDLGGSYAAGDANVLLHIESIARASSNLGYQNITPRPQGDEGLPIFMGDTPNIDKLTLEITKTTQTLINQAAADSSHPLHQIARDHPELIGKTMGLKRLGDFTIPEKGRRMADICEILIHRLGEITDPTPTEDKLRSSSPEKRLLLSRLEEYLHGVHIYPEDTTPEVSAVDAIVAAVSETTDLSPEELSRDNLNKRWSIFDKYCPPSLASDLKPLRDTIAEDPSKNALLLTLAEEAVFDLTQERNPPILNSWAYQELTEDKNLEGGFIYHESGIVATNFLKLINIVDGRLGGNQVLEAASLALTTSAGPPSREFPAIIFCKKGGSYYWSATREGAEKLIANLSSLQDQQIDLLAQFFKHNPSPTPENVASAIRLWSQIPTLSNLPIPATEDRTHEFFGAFMDSLRTNHYPLETIYFDQIAKHCGIQVPRASNLIGIIQDLFIRERFLPRAKTFQQQWDH